MASIYDLKPRFQALLRPLCGGLARAGVTANHVTLAAMIASLAYGAALYFAEAPRLLLLLLPAFLFLRMALNAIDGMLAREYGHKSRLGFYLNELGDVVSDAALYLPFIILPGVPHVLVILAVLVALLTEVAGLLALGIGRARRYDGPFGKSDRAAAFGILAFIAGFTTIPPLVLTAIFAVFILLGILTIINRTSRALTEGTHA